MPEPMTAERLAEIRRSTPSETAREDVEDLLAEVDRLRGQLARLEAAETRMVELEGQVEALRFDLGLERIINPRPPRYDPL